MIIKRCLIVILVAGLSSGSLLMAQEPIAPELSSSSVTKILPKAEKSLSAALNLTRGRRAGQLGGAVAMLGEGMQTAAALYTFDLRRAGLPHEIKSAGSGITIDGKGLAGIFTTLLPAGSLYSDADQAGINCEIILAGVRSQLGYEANGDARPSSLFVDLETEDRVGAFFAALVNSVSQKEPTGNINASRSQAAGIESKSAIFVYTPYNGGIVSCEFAVGTGNVTVTDFPD